jgi:hypothetical protein
MDDFVISNLYESRNEWSSRLVNILTPLVIEGIRSIFNEAWNLCVETDETSKYLMTFQNLLCRVPKWNSVIVEQERLRIIEKSGCTYLEDLITCVHIIQLKVLTSVRVGERQKKIDISIPKLDNFIHKVYIYVARKVYTNVYLFEKNISPLEIQKNNRELEKIIVECILKAIQESIPTEEIVRSYLSESIEHEQEEIIETILDEPSAITESSSSVEKNPLGDALSPDDIDKLKSTEKPETVPVIQNIDNTPIVNKLTFNNIDTVLEKDDTIVNVSAPKNIEHLERLSMEKYSEKNNSDSGGKITIGEFEEDLSLDLDLEDLTPENELSGSMNLNLNNDVPIHLDFEEL